MNTERILALADHIEKLPHYNDVSVNVPHFSMTRYFNECGTPSCIAGHAVNMFTDKKSDELPASLVFEVAAEALELDWDIADKLFTPNVRDAGKYWPMIAPKEAAHTLRHLASTGEVKWLNPLI